MNAIDSIALIYDRGDLDDYHGIFLILGKWAMHIASVDAEGLFTCIVWLQEMNCLANEPQHSIIG